MKQRTGNRPGQGRQPTVVPVGERAESLHVRVVLASAQRWPAMVAGSGFGR